MDPEVAQRFEWYRKRIEVLEAILGDILSASARGQHIPAEQYAATLRELEAQADKVEPYGDRWRSLRYFRRRTEEAVDYWKEAKPSDQASEPKNDEAN